ncbi:MAG: hypothetical protein AAB378_01015 [Patescibacteria group bacterium]
MFGVFVLPWSFVFGLMVYAIARFHWFAEALLLGLALDAVSGMPFGFFTVLFAALILFAEIIGKFFQEDNVFSIIGKSAAFLTAFFILNAAGFIILNWRAGVFGVWQFWQENFYILFHSAFYLAIIFSVHFMIYFIYHRLTRYS